MKSAACALMARPPRVNAASRRRGNRELIMVVLLNGRRAGSEAGPRDGNRGFLKVSGDPVERI
ncbi:hypothetical protein TUM18999_58550 [Pseudomonas tohonis]|uniref:Uncharacterized protein n=1 Tax=Pseudomonas tohonis TaxID=2725477 RepID=A0A6J4EF02_9PSED|nr:hypothetical protein TUM18999_58550 [Pseudomonas tohonis]GJN54205.1 hypothetical protein TUM20286_39570 [Pseudomonas tohonis]